ncbi:DUF5666 domain-containing protein [Marinobacter sp. UBA4489]|jgi:hypothetical protein|uniref:DUF5666 domain-containing protein n=2 Tax=Marinobacter TaxID=2742 RepID=UPI000A745EB9|nr:DUF5666 domain-containing protein [Marinobacter sp. UBA4489]
MENSNMKRHIRNRVIGLAAGTVAFGVISACGGGGSGGGLDVADGGIRGTGSSVGPVSGFGSVFVNGVRFDTRDLNGAVESNDGIDAETQLSEGMILRVDGEWSDNGEGVAESLEYDDTFRGAVSDVTLSQNNEQVTFTIYGQELFATTQTVFRGTTLANLTNDDFVRVSAYRGPDGLYRASFVGTATRNESDIELEVDLSNAEFDAGNNQILSNGFTITYADNVFANGLTEADLEAGGFFEIEGELMVPNEINAISIDRDDFRRYQQGEGDDIELTGTVQTRYVADGGNPRPGELTLAGLTIRIVNETELDDGLTLDSLQPGLLIQVEGKFIGDSVVEAEEIELREPDSKVKGSIDVNSVDPSSRRFEVGGVKIQVTPLTTLTRDDDGEIDFAQLTAFGTKVEVEGIERGAPDSIYVQALKVEVESEEDDASSFELEGRLRFISLNPSANGLSILGITMSDLGADYDGDNESTARQEIVDAFEGPEPVFLEVEYFNTSSGFVADEVELESEDDD